MPEQKCPLCEEIAKFKHAPFGTRNECFSCPNCLNFVISPRAKELVLASPKKHRTSLSDQSKNVSLGKILIIFIENEDGKEHVKFCLDEEAKWF